MSQTSPVIETLKPCPFCGCPGQKFKDFWDSGQIDCFGCKDCGISFERDDEWNRRDGVAQRQQGLGQGLRCKQVGGILMTKAEDISSLLAHFFPGKQTVRDKAALAVIEHYAAHWMPLPAGPTDTSTDREGK